MTLAARLEALAADFARNVVTALHGASLGELAELTAVGHRDTKPANKISSGGGMKHAPRERRPRKPRSARRAPAPSPAPVAVEPSRRKPARAARRSGAPAVPVLFGGRGRVRGSDEEE